MFSCDIRYQVLDKKAMNRYMSRAYDPIVRLGKAAGAPPELYQELARQAYRDARDRFRAAANDSFELAD